MKRTIFILTTAMAVSSSFGQDKPKKPLGYQDSPLIPGTKWHVHDGERPQPKVVTPGEFSTQEKVGSAPSDAVVLFDGKDLNQWRHGNGKDATWKVENGYAEVAPKSGDIFTKAEFGPDVQLHLEFATPPPEGDGQGRGNSGAFLFGRYEIQILDSYNNPTYPDGQATAIYGQTPPLVNASRKPGEWQVYDIVFNGPRFNADGTVAKPASATVFHNGVLTQNNTVLIGDTPHRNVGKYSKHGEKGPIKLQDHSNPMRFRNIWIRELKPVDSQ
jgi:hypothetical protein